jgi:hypothetical protein
MSLEQTAQPTFYMTPTSTRDLAVSFVGTLSGSELLTGTPTVTISTGGPTISGAAVNTSTLKIETPPSAGQNVPPPHHAKAGQAVVFRATASGTAAASYTVSMSCATVGGQVITGYATIVVQGS